MVTDRQKNAISFCKEMLGVDFDGDIEDYNQVSSFLSKYLEKAKKYYRIIIDDASFSIFEIY